MIEKNNFIAFKAQVQKKNFFILRFLKIGTFKNKFRLYVKTSSSFSSLANFSRNLIDFNVFHIFAIRLKKKFSSVRNFFKIFKFLMNGLMYYVCMKKY
jgi:hypothetical protein